MQLKKLDKIEERICETQAMLYEWAANERYLFPEFSDIYMRSEFCKRSMDALYSRFQLREPLELLDFLIPENPGIDNVFEENKQFDGAVAYWIGYMYRYLATAMQISSKEIIERYSFNKMCGMYPGMHTVDYEMAADMMVGNKGDKND